MENVIHFEKTKQHYYLHAVTSENC